MTVFFLRCAYRSEFGGGQDIGIDLVCQTVNKEYWAVQCKCYREDTPISREEMKLDENRQEIGD